MKKIKVSNQELSKLTTHLTYFVEQEVIKALNDFEYFCTEEGDFNPIWAENFYFHNRFFPDYEKDVKQRLKQVFMLKK